MVIHDLPLEKSNTVISEPVSQPDDTALRLIIQGVTVEITNQATQSAIQNTLSVLRYLESERFCDWCNAEMVSVSSKFVREEIRITPAKVERIRYMQEVLVCPECHKDYDGSFKSGIVPKALIPHSPASASAVAYVMFQKCFMGLPYYRMESAFKQLGAKIPRETMANWCIITARNYLLPVFVRLHEELLKRDIIHADELCKALHNSSYEKLNIM